MKAKEENTFNEHPATSFTGIIEFCDGTKYIGDIRISHFKNGTYHDENLPAIEWVCSGPCWWLNGRWYTKEMWKFEVKKLRKMAPPK